MRTSESLPAAYGFAAGAAAPKENGLRWESRGSPIIRWTVLACCLPYPGDPKSAIDCSFLFGISLHPGVTGSAPHWKFRGCRVHSFPSPQELLRPASWLALLRGRLHSSLRRRGRPQSASNMTTWINSRFHGRIFTASPTALWAAGHRITLFSLASSFRSVLDIEGDQGFPWRPDRLVRGHAREAGIFVAFP